MTSPATMPITEPQVIALLDEFDRRRRGKGQWKGRSQDTRTALVGVIERAFVMAAHNAAAIKDEPGQPGSYY